MATARTTVKELTGENYDAAFAIVKDYIKACLICGMSISLKEAIAAAEKLVNQRFTEATKKRMVKDIAR